MRNSGPVAFVLLLLFLAPLLQTDVPSEHIGPGNGQTMYTRPRAPGDATDIGSLLAGLEGSFTENLGQLDDPDVLYYARGQPLSAGFMRRGVTFNLVRPDVGGQERMVVFTMSFEGCNDVEPRASRPMSHPTNFFIGNDPEGWITGARSLREVCYEALWDGIDLVFYFRDGMLKYDLVMDAGADTDQIVLRYEGVESLEVEEGSGDLVISTELGRLRDQMPVLLDTRGGSPLDSASGFRFLGGHSVGFEVSSSCRRGSSFVIDPGLQWSTYFGGSAGEWIASIDLDGDGNIYIVGSTASVDIQTTPGVYNPTKTGIADGFVVKMDNNGSSLLLATYLGGSDDDLLDDLWVASDGRIYLAGITNSTDFPVTDDAIAEGPLGGGNDLILARMDAQASTLEYGTYLGGDGWDVMEKVWLLDDGTTYLMGATNSTDLPTDPGAYCRTGGGTTLGMDCYVMRLDSSLSKVLNCTYLGGSGRDGYYYWDDRLQYGCGDLYVEDSGQVCIVGCTSSRDFPTTDGSIYTEAQGGIWEGFVSKLDANLSRLLGSTYLGGSHDLDVATEVAVGTDGTVYVTGKTMSADFPTTEDAICATLSSSWTDAYLTVFESDLSDIKYSTFIGGTSSEGENCIALGPDEGTVLIWGSTVSTDFPCTPGAFDQEHGGSFDCFLYEVNLTTMDLTYATLVGGTDLDTPYRFRCLTVDARGMAYLCGLTDSEDFPVTEGAYQQARSGGFDAFVIKLDPDPCDPPSPPSNLTATASEAGVTLNWTNPRFDGALLTELRVYKHNTSAPGNWSLVGSLDPSTEGWFDPSAIPGVRHKYRISAVNSAGEGEPSGSASAVYAVLPGQPHNLTATPNLANWTVNLTWLPPMSMGGGTIEGYMMFRGETEDDLAKLAETGNVTRFVDTTTKKGEVWYYAVSARNERGFGSQCNPHMVKLQGPPSEPRGFTAEPGDSRVHLAWNTPLDNGGSMLLGYRVFGGTSPDDLTLHTNLSRDTNEYMDTNLVNGVVYYYYVIAYNGVTDGARTLVLSAVPFGYPGAPQALHAVAANSSVNLSWSPPENDGGRPIDGYLLYVSGLTSPIELGNVTTYTRLGLTNGKTYTFQVAAVNEAGNGPRSEIATAVPMARPSAPTRFKVESVSKVVVLSWNPPADWGGAESLTYLVLRGSTGDSLEPLAVLTDLYSYTDSTVEAGIVYFYSIQAGNAVGLGGATTVTVVRVPSAPGPVANLTAVPGDGWIRLSWSPPGDDGGSEVTEYVLLRGMVEIALDDQFFVGMELRYRDTNVVNGHTYHYAVYAINEFGDGVRCAVVSATPWAVPNPPASIRIEASGDQVVITWEPPTSDGNAPGTGYIVLRGTSEGDLRQIADMGLVLAYTDAEVEEGRTYYYQVIAKSDMGPSEPTVVVKVTMGTHDGSRLVSPWLLVLLAVLATVGAIVAFAFQARSREPEAVAADEVAGPAIDGEAVEEVISMLSAVDFHRGYVRLKVAAVNDTPETIVNTAVEVRYDPDMLRLERVEPDTLPLKGDRVTLGVVKPRERKTAAFLFDPQICQGTHIDGNLTYYDARDKFHSMEMKRRHADVVCPVFSTRETANTAMLRRLVKEELHQNDYRVFLYPMTFLPADVLRIGKRILGMSDLQMVREFVKGGPPYEAEVWYYGETRVRGYQMVMRLGVVQEKRVLELFVASTSMETVTGLIAEFRRELERIVREEHPPGTVIEPARDEDIRSELQERALMLDKDDLDVDNHQDDE